MFINARFFQQRIHLIEIVSDSTSGYGSKLYFSSLTVICDACKIATEYIRGEISTCMPNSRHEFSSSCSCVDQLYRSKFGAKDRPAGVNNLYIVRFSLSVFHLNTNEPFSTVRFQRTKGKAE